MQLVIDVGGTKTASAVINSSGKIFWSHRQETQKGKENFVKMIQNIIKEAQNHHTLNPLIKIAIPGKLKGPNKDIITPDTGTQLGKFPHEFDNLNLTELLGTTAPHFTLLFINDAIAQFVGGLHQIDPKHFQNLTVGYIGPGTGLGGGFAHIDEAGKIEIITDGHIFDILIPEPAENILSGRGILEKNGYTAKEINKVTHPKFNEISDKLGKALAALIEKIYTGEIVKNNPHNNWPKKDCELVKRTTHFLLGGSIGTTLPLSKKMISLAQRLLERKGITDIHFYPIPHPDRAAWDGLNHT